MKKMTVLIIATAMLMPWVASAQKTKKIIRGEDSQSQVQRQLSQALKNAQNGQSEAAANALFSLARKAELEKERPQIKYILGNMLMEMNLHQIAAFQFVDVIRLNNPKYKSQAIGKLAIVADNLGDDTILNYAISRIDVNDIPASNKDLVNFRLGEIKLRNHDFTEAQELFKKIGPGSTHFYQGLYSKALAELEAGQTDQAISTLRTMLETRNRAPVTDINKVEAQLGLARALYQKHDWEASIEAYSLVPRDTLMWHDAIFEQTWAFLRAAKYRSALSNFQSLHSAYYEDFYMPESLLLRSIVYLYICKYDEMEKVLGLFEKTYGSVKSKIRYFLANYNDPMVAFSELEMASRKMKGTDPNPNLRLPYMISKNALDQGDVKRSLRYLEKLAIEKARIDGNSSFRASSLGQYALKIIANRSSNTKIAIGEMVRSHLQKISSDLSDLYEQAGMIRYEMTNGRKEAIKKKMDGREISNGQIDENVGRQFYIKNGYEYYPFQGEYWLDEIGNYHFLGKQSCE